MIINTILSMDYWKKLELRVEGKRAASQMISTIQEFCADINNYLTIACIGLARFSEADETKDGYKMALHYYGKVRDWYKLVGHGVKILEVLMDAVKSKRDGREVKPFSDDILNEIRARYEKSGRERGESSTGTLHAE